MSDNDMYIDNETLELAKQLAEKKRIAKEKKEQKEKRDKEREEERNEKKKQKQIIEKQREEERNEKKKQKQIREKQREEDRKRKEEKQNEKRKEKKKKEKIFENRINVVQSKLDALREVEKCWNIEERLKKEAVRQEIVKFYKTGLTPHNPLARGKAIKDLFYGNAEAFVRLITRIKGNPENMGVINSTKVSVVCRGKPYVKTKYGIYAGSDASDYLRYVIQNYCLAPIKLYLANVFKLSEDAVEEDGSKSLDDCLRSLALFQLFCRASQDYILDILMKCYLDEEFGFELTKVGSHSIKGLTMMSSKVREMILRKDVKQQQASADAFAPSDSESESDSETEEEEEVTESDTENEISESDSDSE